VGGGGCGGPVGGGIGEAVGCETGRDCGASYMLGLEHTDQGEY